MRHITFAFFGLFLLVSCSSPSPQSTKIEIEQLPFSHNPENPKEAIEVWSSMARAAKYNIEVAVDNYTKKLSAAQQAKAPLDALAPFADETSGSNELFNTYKTLNLAILISQDDKKAHFQDVAQNLLLAGVSSYHQASFASKKKRDLDREINKKRKDIEALNKKEERINTLSPKDAENKKALEVFLVQIKELEEAFANDLAFFGNLEKVDMATTTFGSQRFFDGSNWDNSLTLENFEKIAQKNNKINNLEVEKNELFKAFPEATRLSLNNMDYKNPLITQEIILKNNHIVTALLNKKISINKAKVAQIELAYYMVKLAEVVNLEAQLNYQTGYNELKRRQKDNKKLSDVLAQEIEVLRLDRYRNQTVSHKTVAIQNLYFLTEPLPLNREFFNPSITEIAKKIKKYTSSNLAEVLAVVEAQKIGIKVGEVSNWTSSENWLEEVVETKSEALLKKGESKSILQLGSYHNYKNANDLVKSLPALAYKPEIERASVDGTTVYRVIIKSENNDLTEICAKLKDSEINCILR